MAYRIPEDLRYSSTHEWARLEGDTVVVGITDYAQARLGDIVYVELPEVGESYAQGETFGVVESVKATSDLYAPMAGTVLAVNETLVDDPSAVNRDPYGEGWLVRFSISNAAEWEALLDAAAYAQLLEEGGH
jgi:glycine cleavage system H protein